MNQTLQRSEKVHFIIGIVSTVLILAISVLLKWMGLTIFPYNNIQSAYLEVMSFWTISMGLLTRGR